MYLTVCLNVQGVHACLFECTLVCLCCVLQNWPEATDPSKFVYEDIAIASYLLVGFPPPVVNDGCQCRVTAILLPLSSGAVGGGEGERGE